MDYDAVQAEPPSAEASCSTPTASIESRAGRELYGSGRLDDVLAAGSGLDAQALAEAILEDCRAFGGGELADDCAVVVKRTA